MRFKRCGQRVEILPLLPLAPFVSMLLLMVVFGLMTSAFMVPSALEVKLPRALTSDVVGSTDIAIIITSEDIVYYNQRIVSMATLRRRLADTENLSKSVLIKVDRRASVGKVVEIWDLCRSLGIARVAIAANNK